MSTNSSGSQDPFSPKNSNGPSPPSKRRQKQLEMRRSISPTPGKSLDAKLEGFKQQAGVRETSRGKVAEDSDGDDYGEDPSHAGDYSMDDFEVDSPRKRLGTGHDLNQLPPSAPVIAKATTAPLPVRTKTKEEEEAQKSMDEIRNRWASMASGA